MKNSLIILATALTLSACSTVKDVIVKPQLVQKPILTVPNPIPANQAPVDWVVITRDNFEIKFKEIEDAGGSVVFFALTPQGYQNLSLNVAELRRYIQQQSSIIVTIKNYYEAPINQDIQK
jgi:hypothetical protein